MMIRFLTVLLLLAAAQASPVTLAWDHSPDAAVLDGYRLYELLGPGRSVVAQVSRYESQATIEVTPGVHSYVVVAFNVWGESVDSNIASTPPATFLPPGNLGLEVITLTLEASGDLIHWQPVATYTDTAKDRQFYRLAWPN